LRELFNILGGALHLLLCLQSCPIEIVFGHFKNYALA
jgi:hypothetical protein